MGIWEGIWRASKVLVEGPGPGRFTAVGKPVDLSPEEIAEQILDLAKWPDFRGYGPLPRIKVADDGRAQPFRLTTQGAKLLEKAAPAWKMAQQQAKQILGDGIVKELGQAMVRMKSDVHTE